MAKAVVIDTEVLENFKPDEATKEFFGRWEESPEWSIGNTDACTYAAGPVTDFNLPEPGEGPSIVESMRELERAMVAASQPSVTLTINTDKLSDDAHDAIMKSLHGAVNGGEVFSILDDDLADGQVNIRVQSYTVSAGPGHPSFLSIEGQMEPEELSALSWRGDVAIQSMPYGAGAFGGMVGLCTPSRSMPITGGGGYLSGSFSDLPQPMYGMDEYGRYRAIQPRS